MNKEFWKDKSAYDVVFNHFDNCTCQEGKFLVRSALDHIYQVIKRNEPTKVMVRPFVPATDPRDYYCGSCGGYITSGRLGNIRYDAKNNVFCRHCGKKLNWGNENE